MGDGPRREFIETEAGAIHVAVAGEGPPLLLLHGFPQTHVMWFRIAPALAEDFTVVMPDLRGYGDSAKPAGDPAHEAYSKRSMAADQVQVMEALGFDLFQVVGHDRGARVAHRMALDHPERVRRLALLDILPTLTVFEQVNSRIALDYYHWFFLAQPADLPERMIGADPDFYLRRTIASWCGTEGAIADEAMGEYLRCFRDPAAIHAACEDYRAGATIDLEHDRADRKARIRCPTLVLWGDRGLAGAGPDVLAIWREKAEDVRGHALDCGHFLAEERPAETYEALIAFLDRDAAG